MRSVFILARVKTIDPSDIDVFAAFAGQLTEQLAGNLAAYGEALRLPDGGVQFCLKIAAQVERSALTQVFFDLNRSVSESAIKADGA